MNIALLGYGIEGESAYRYYTERYPRANFMVLDNAAESKKTLPKGVDFIGNVESFLDIDADIVVRTPAISPRKISSRGKVTSVTKEFFAQCPAPIIGVTGTKGKGTTCTLITKILENAGKKVWLVGNIGNPALDALTDITPDDIVVYELSSFQLWDLEQSPEAAVVLLIEPDHLDIHKDFDEYIKAKMNIAQYQKETDLVVFHPTNLYSAEIADRSRGEKKHYQTPEGAYIKDEHIVIEDHIICAVNEAGLPGAHNLENICAAVTTVWRYTQDIEAIASAIQSFSGLPHHIEKVREISGVTFYDDSFSSAPTATVAAIKSFTQPEVVIVGGYEKHADFSELVDTIRQANTIKKVLLIGQTAERIAAQLQASGESRYEICETKDFSTIVQRAFSVARDGDIVLLSPGCASFDMFNNFYERGKEFQKIVRSL